MNEQEKKRECNECRKPSSHAFIGSRGCRGNYGFGSLWTDSDGF